MVQTVNLSISHWYPAQVCCLIVSIPDLCTLIYFEKSRRKTKIVHAFKELRDYEYSGMDCPTFSLQLTIHVADPLKDSNLCNKGPNFLEAGTLAPYFKQSYKLPFKNAQLPFKADKPDVT